MGEMTLTERDVALAEIQILNLKNNLEMLEEYLKSIKERERYPINKRRE